MKTQSQNEKISENLFGAREGCVGPDYSASLSHLFLSLNHMHLSFLASDLLHPVGLSDFGMAQVYLLSKKTARKTLCRRRDGTEGRSARSSRR